MEKAIGVSSANVIPDYRFTASTFYNIEYTPYSARLNGPEGWTSKMEDRKTCSLNIDLGNVYMLCAVETQGYAKANKLEWTTKYALNVSINNIEWTEYTEEGESRVSYFIFIYLYQR